MMHGQHEGLSRGLGLYAAAYLVSSSQSEGGERSVLSQGRFSVTVRERE